MMAILRFEPGANAPHDGVFALVGHYGEPTGFVCECRAGDNLPDQARVTVPDRALWFVFLENGSEVRLAA
jgi:hypothetical protein